MSSGSMSKTVTAAASTKFKIEQNVPSGSVKKGPYAVERSVDPNEVVIKRRFGEGSKPLFQRDDIAVNCSDPVAETHSNAKACTNTGAGFVSGNSKAAAASHWRIGRRSSSASSSPERYRQHGSHRLTGRSHHPHTYSTKNSGSYSTKRSTSHGQREQDKVPYFLDEVRERDRLRRIYGSSGSRGGVATGSNSSTKRPRRSRSKSRSGSPPVISVKSRTHQSHSSATTHRHRSSSRTRYDRSPGTHVKHRSRGSERRRSLSSDSSRHKGRRQNQHQHQHTRDATRRRGSRSLSRSRTRSRERERERNHRTHDRERVEQTSLTPQIITIPVPVPAEYAFGYPTWAAHPQWGAPTGLPPPRFAHYGMLQAPLMPPLRAPPPYGAPPPQYGGRMFRPQQQRYPFNRRGYRPRNA